MENTTCMFGQIIPDPVIMLINRLEEAGHPSYLVGGCVRDSLLGLPFHDFDVATAATPSQVEELFSDCRIIPTGIKHGTLTVVYNSTHIEVTTFRKEGGYADHRRPDSVEFTRLPREDAARRDFTVNALCYNPKTGLLDFFGGKDDLEKRLLRTVGDPCQRFEEDALRIMRAIRFAAVLGFDIEERTAAAMDEKAYLITSLAAERVLAEIKLLLAGRYADKVLAKSKHILRYALGGDGMCVALNAYTKEQRLPVFFAYYGGCTDGALRYINRLKPDGKTKKAVLAASTAVYGSGFADKVALARAVRSFGIENGEMMCTILKQRGKISKLVAEYFYELKTGNAPVGLRDLNISGTDLENAGIAKAAGIGATLEKLYDFVHNGGKNEKNALLEEARRITVN